MLVVKRSRCNAQVSIIIAYKNMHDCIIDKTCIDRIIEHSTDCFHKEPFVVQDLAVAQFVVALSKSHLPTA